jgi:multisubunit Na+/H+ antiporter MnhB subunit
MTEYIWNLFDVLLAAVILALAWMALSSTDRRRGVIFFIGFGLALALVWARLKAPDVALAEAAIGAGLSGALLLAAASDPEHELQANLSEEQPYPPRWIRWIKGLISVLCFALAGIFSWAYIDAFTAADPARLNVLVADNLQASGVSNPVTAVLLNFRAYDTLLELAVLLAAMLGIAALAPARQAYHSPGTLFVGLVDWLVPSLIVTGAYLLWTGSHAPGGAFQAGALLAAAGVLLRLAGIGQAGLPVSFILRVTTVAGVAVFTTVGLIAMLLGGSFLEFPSAWAGSLILLIETMAMFSIAVILVVAFLGGRPESWEASFDNSLKRKL